MGNSNTMTTTQIISTVQEAVAAGLAQLWDQEVDCFANGLDIESEDMDREEVVQAIMTHLKEIMSKLEEIHARDLPGRPIVKKVKVVVEDEEEEDEEEEEEEEEEEQPVVKPKKVKKVKVVEEDDEDDELISKPKKVKGPKAKKPKVEKKDKPKRKLSPYNVHVKGVSAAWKEENGTEMPPGGMMKYASESWANSFMNPKSPCFDSDRTDEVMADAVHPE